MCILYTYINIYCISIYKFFYNVRSAIVCHDTFIIWAIDLNWKILFEIVFLYFITFKILIINVCTKKKKKKKEMI